MKPSQIFWVRFCQIAYTILVLFSLWVVYTMFNDNKDIAVPVTVTGKYATGYHGKHSVGEDFYISCYNPTYGSMAINTGYETYNSLNLNDHTVFTLSKIKIDMYSTSDSNLTSKLLPIYMVLAIFVLAFLLFLIGDFIVTKLIPKFNNFLDKHLDKSN